MTSKLGKKEVGRKCTVVVDTEEEDEEEEEGDEDDDEEDGGFLPAGNDENRETPAVSKRSGSSMTGKGKGNGKGASPGSELKGWSEDWSDLEGGGFLVDADIEKETSVNTTGQAPGLASGALGNANGKGKGKAREKGDAREQQEDDPLATDSSENDEAMSGNGKKRKHRRLERTAHGSDMDDDEDDGNENNSVNRPRQPSAPGLLWSQESVLDVTAASEAVARKLQEEEDERAAVSLQRGSSAIAGSPSSVRNGRVSLSLGPVIGATSTATETGEENSVSRSAGAGNASVETETEGGLPEVVMRRERL